ncbi:hypothetical protein HYFRA_00006784 [Hymenoscyphus fraxineus]|uniref:Uncharacterized protein n=1 Tax=Hymenoscyphus fraxineus TaxID=746836 RepID=A0A9N9KND2_9HELO|nr:hypothetical protein HYFRA_00006784 [Hymenoscyphus fraxineus]
MLLPSVFFAVTVLSILVAGIPVTSTGTGALSTRGLRTEMRTGLRGVFGSRREGTGLFAKSKTQTQEGEKVNPIKGTPLAKGEPGSSHVEPLRKSNLPPKIPEKNVIWIQGKPIPKGAPGNPHVEPPLRKSNLPNPKHNGIWIQGKPIPKGAPGNPH